jgi:hypothetical protein
MKKLVDLSRILTKDHEKKWVALSTDYKKVLGYSSDLIDLRKKMKGDEEVVYLKMPESGRRYSF